MNDVVLPFLLRDQGGQRYPWVLQARLIREVLVPRGHQSHPTVGNVLPLLENSTLKIVLKHPKLYDFVQTTIFLTCIIEQFGNLDSYERHLID